MRGRARRRADAAVETAVQLVVVAQVGLDVAEDRLELRARDRRRLGDRIPGALLHPRGGLRHRRPRRRVNTS